MMRPRKLVDGFPVITEEQVQISYFRQVRLNEPRYPEMARIFSVPNGQLRHPAVAAKLKAGGVRAGVVDVWWPLRRGGYNGFVFEFKAGKNKATASQESWLEFMLSQGWNTGIFYGAEEAWVETLSYYKLPG